MGTQFGQRGHAFLAATGHVRETACSAPASTQTSQHETENTHTHRYKTETYPNECIARPPNRPPVTPITAARYQKITRETRDAILRDVQGAQMLQLTERRRERIQSISLRVVAIVAAAAAAVTAVADHMSPREHLSWVFVPPPPKHTAPPARVPAGMEALPVTVPAGSSEAARCNSPAPPE